MKKLMLSSLFVIVSLFVFSQSKIDLHLPQFQQSSNKKLLSRVQIEPTVGLGLLAGGIVIGIAGLTTPPVTMEDEHNNIVNKPFINQGPRALAIVTGGVMIGAGIIISMGK